MRWTPTKLFLLCQLTAAGALPIPHRMLSGAFTDVKLLQYDADNASTKFELGPGFHAESDELTSPLVFDLQVSPAAGHTQPYAVLLNSHQLDITWTPPDHSGQPITVEPKTYRLVVPDRAGFDHTLQLDLTGKLTWPSGADAPAHSLHFHIDTIDASPSGLSFTVLARPAASRRLLKLIPAVSSDAVDFDLFEESFMLDPKAHHVTANEPVGYDQDAFDIEAEIESLLLLEAEAGQLHSAIAAKKEALAKCLKGHRDHVSLRHLLSQCDGLVCAAKVIAQRVCDKMGILTVPNVAYAKIQDPTYQQNLIDLYDEKPAKSSAHAHLVSEEHINNAHMKSMQSGAAIQSVRLVYPQSVLFKVLGAIATALGLTALFAYIRRKCMSERRKVEHAADAEERRNARAYRRAARRAEMRRRWDALVTAINCFGSEAESRTQDYEEKRALILQDAFLEQDTEVAEKGEVMEAEIRELRHAHEIVASLIRVDEHRYDLVTPVHDPPPPMVALPYTPVSRSRASSATLPSYTSEALPDYTSRYTRTEAGSTQSSSSSIRSSSSAVITSTATSEDGNGSTSRSQSPQSSNVGSRRSRYTPTSSVLETSPRPSAETLRTNCRYSRDTSRS